MPLALKPEVIESICRKYCELMTLNPDEMVEVQDSQGVTHVVKGWTLMISDCMQQVAWRVAIQMQVEADEANAKPNLILPPGLNG